MTLSNDAIIFGMGYLSHARARLSFGGVGAQYRITQKARDALNELLEAGYAVPTSPDQDIEGRESYTGVTRDPTLAQLAFERKINLFEAPNWVTFEKDPGSAGEIRAEISG